GHQARHVEAREVLAAAAQAHPQHQAAGALLEDAVDVGRLELVVLEGGVARGHREAVERGDHGGRLAAAVAHAPLTVDPLGADGHHRQHQERADHFVAPTTTWLKASGVKYFWATRCTSAAVTLATLAL